MHTYVRGNIHCECDKTVGPKENNTLSCSCLWLPAINITMWLCGVAFLSVCQMMESDALSVNVHDGFLFVCVFCVCIFWTHSNTVPLLLEMGSRSNICSTVYPYVNKKIFCLYCRLYHIYSFSNVSMRGKCEAQWIEPWFDKSFILSFKINQQNWRRHNGDAFHCQRKMSFLHCGWPWMTCRLFKNSVFPIIQAASFSYSSDWWVL